MRNILTKLMLLIVASAVYVSPIFAKEVGVEPISLKLLSAWTDLEQSSRKSLHVRYCAYNITVDGSNMGTICARLKSTRAGVDQWDAIILETRDSTIKFKTREPAGQGHYKFWLKDYPDSDDASISSFLRQFTDVERAAFGAFCKKIASTENITPKTVEINRRVKSSHFKSISLSQRDRDLKIAARRCYKAVERSVGEIVFVQTSKARELTKAAKTTSVCGYKFDESQSRSDLIAVQKGLAKRKLYTGGIDGVFGSGSCKAFNKWAECESVGQKTISGGSLAKLTKTNPSARELSCYGNKSVNIAKLSFSGFDLRPVDGRSEGRDIIGSWVTLKNVRINGKIGAKKTIWFEFLGRLPSQGIEEIGFSSKQTFSNMPTDIGGKSGNPKLGYLLPVGPNNVSGARSRFQKLNQDDKLILKGICGLMADESFVSDIVESLKNQKEFGFRGYVDNEFMNYWKSGSRVREILEVAKGCNQAVGNLGANKVAFISVDRNLPSTTSTTSTNSITLTNDSCFESKWKVRSNQNVLKDLGLYNSTVDGIAGPNYRKAVAGGEKLLGQGADDQKGCLSLLERNKLMALASAPDANNPLIPPASDDTVVPETKQTESVLVVADSATMTARKETDVTTISLLMQGSDLETSLMSKSIFGLNNQVQIDVEFDMSKGSPILDFIVSDRDTKINLKPYDLEVTNRVLAASLPELEIGNKADGYSSFSIRMFDNGKSNIDNGDFGKLLAQMQRADHVMLSALCGHIAGISTSSDGFEAQFSSSDDKDIFRSSLFSNRQVQDAVNTLATQCVAEIRTTGLVEASFKINTSKPICTAVQTDELASLDSQIATEQQSLLGIKDQINQLQTQRPLLNLNECSNYSDDMLAKLERLKVLETEVSSSETSIVEIIKAIDTGSDFGTRLAALKEPTDVCKVENGDLQSDINAYMQQQNPMFIGIQCPNSDDAPKNPMQIVIDEINIDILALLEVHISSDQIDALRSQRDAKKQEIADFQARLVDFEQVKASPDEIQNQIQMNTSLRQTIEDIEGRIVILSNEILDLTAVLEENSGTIAKIDALNQRLVGLSADKESRQVALDQAKSTSLGAQAVISQRELEISKLEAQMTDLDVQMEAASSTAGSLVAEVDNLTQEIAETGERVVLLESKVTETRALIDNANGAIGQKSQEVSKLDAELTKKVAASTLLTGSVSTLTPQADAAESTVEDMRMSLETNFVSIEQYQEQEARLNEVTQIVTERTKLIRELRTDLASIEQEEQLLIKMCIADAQCKAAMGERLGVEQ
jgi:hypothetical protein